MRFADLMRFALGALTHHKLRTLLTLLGVLLGSFTLVLSFSVGLGVQAETLKEFKRHGELLQIEVWPQRTTTDEQVPPEVLQLNGSMTPDKQERIRKALRRQWLWFHSPKQKYPLNRKTVEELEHLPHVARVVPAVRLFGRAYFGDRPGRQVNGYGASTEDDDLSKRLVAGEYFSSPDAPEVLVHEFLLYEWGVTSEEQVQSALGKQLRIRLPIHQRLVASPLWVSEGDLDDWAPAENEALRQALARLPANLDRLDLKPAQRDALRKALLNMRLGLGDEQEPGRELTLDLTIRGVFRDADDSKHRRFSEGGEGTDFALPLRSAANSLLQTQGENGLGFDRLLVHADSEENVQTVSQEISARGLETFSMAEALDQVRMTILLITFATGFIAVIALLVAAIGIANVMLMSVLERTREIGVMKAVGAQERHIQLIFLIEGAGLGLVGGGLGLVAGWLASFPGNAFATSMISERMKEPFTGTVFIFPPWLLGTVLVFTILVTTLAALYPARRASRINPILALRTE